MALDIINNKIKHFNGRRNILKQTFADSILQIMFKNKEIFIQAIFLES